MRSQLIHSSIDSSCSSSSTHSELRYKKSANLYIKVKCFVDKTYGLSNFFQEKYEFKIQILAGNTLLSRFHVSFGIELHLFFYIWPIV